MRIVATDLGIEKILFHADSADLSRFKFDICAYLLKSFEICVKIKHTAYLKSNPKPQIQYEKQLQISVKFICFYCL